MPLLLLLLACARPTSLPDPDAPQVRYRPADPPDADARWLVSALPDGQWDGGLANAASALLERMAARDARLDPASASLAAARAGFPGQARFSRLLNGGAMPEELVDAILAASGGAPVDVGLARRTYGDGVTLWVLGWAPHLAEIDPLPAALPLDEAIALRVDYPPDAEARLFLAPPDGPVEELSLRPRSSRWLEPFRAPGPYRIEVVLKQGKQTNVALLFSVFVDQPPPALPALTNAQRPPPNPHLAEQHLYKAVNALRAERKLPPLERFPLFEPLAREHSALMAAYGTISHTIPSVTDGVPRRAAAFAYPRANHTENVAAASTAEEALAVVVDSPGHLSALLCEPCTHLSVGAALEPVLDRAPRLFVTWEMLEFPHGPPREIDGDLDMER